MTAPPTARRAAWLWLPTVVWAGVIFAFSAVPHLRLVQSDIVDFVVRKGGHMFVFGVLAVLIWRALGSLLARRALAWSWMLAAAYAASDEFHQAFTEGRHPSPVDVGIDSVGALLALVVLVAWLRVRARRRAQAIG